MHAHAIHLPHSDLVGFSMKLIVCREFDRMASLSTLEVCVTGFPSFVSQGRAAIGARSVGLRSKDRTLLS